MAKISKNNPVTREQFRLAVYCPDCGKEMRPVKVVAMKGGAHMVYSCTDATCGRQEPLSPQSYKSMNHDWVKR